MMNELWFPPAAILFAGAFLAAICRGTAQRLAVILTPMAALLFILLMGEGELMRASFLTYDVSLVENSGLRQVFALAMVLALLGALVFALPAARRLELASALALGGAALGVVFAGDLLMLFVFWELMVIFSVIIIWNGGELAKGAGLRFVILHLLAGLLFKIGIELVYASSGTHAIAQLTLQGAGPWLIAIALLVNAAAAPLSVWLTDSYPKATPTGTVFLSLFMTSSAVLIMMQIFAGAEQLLLFGLLMILYAMIYGLREDNIRRLLSFALVAHIGFMVCGVAIGTLQSLNAVAVFAVLHIFAMALLFMSAAAVINATGVERLSELGAMSRCMPATYRVAAIGSLIYFLAPLSSGLLLAMGEAGEWLLQAVLVTAAAAAVLHGGLKYLGLVFYRRSHASVAEDPAYAQRLALMVVAVPALMLLLHGPLLSIWMVATPFQSWLSMGQLTIAIILLSAGIMLSYVLREKIIQPSPLQADFDIVYRQWLLNAWQTVEAMLIKRSEAILRFARGPLAHLPRRWFHVHGPQGPLARTWATGSMLMWVTVILAVLLIGARLM